MTIETALDRLYIEDDERLKYLIESPMWENVIRPALNEFGTILPLMIEAGRHDVIATLIKGLTQSIYVHGCREGAKQRSSLIFICPEEATDDQS